MRPRRRKPLDTLQRIAEHAADASSREVSQRLRALLQEEQRLAQLAGYVSDYQKFAAKGTAGLTIGAIRSRRSFVERLGDAVSRQQQVVRTQEEQYRQHIERWRLARSRALGLQRFNERIRDEATERQERHEQAALDEISRRKS
jgi:flagellar export protein FliJ